MFDFLAIPNKPKALPIKSFSKEGDYCWEDWERDSKKKYPVRYFLYETIPRYFSSKIYSYRMRYYDFVSIYFTKDHLIDIRNVYNSKEIIDPVISYKGGYIDNCDKMSLAIVKVFLDYVKEEQDFHRSVYKKEFNIDTVNEIQEPEMSFQKERYLMVLELYEYFTNTYPEKYKNLINNCGYKQMEELEEEFNSKLIEVIKIRRTLWT